MTVTATPSLDRYRENHVITLDESGPFVVCSHDGVRVYTVRGLRWRHDTAQLAGLIRQSYGGTWPSRTEGEDAVARAVASDLARDDVLVNGRITVERPSGNQTFAVDLDIE